MEAARDGKSGVFFQVEKVIGVSSDGNYQVQWAPAWVSKFHLVGCEHLIQEFLQHQHQHQEQRKKQPLKQYQKQQKQQQRQKQKQQNREEHQNETLQPLHLMQEILQQQNPQQQKQQPQQQHQHQQQKEQQQEKHRQEQQQLEQQQLEQQQLEEHQLEQQQLEQQQQNEHQQQHLNQQHREPNPPKEATIRTSENIENFSDVELIKIEKEDEIEVQEKLDTKYTIYPSYDTTMPDQYYHGELGGVWDVNMDRHNTTEDLSTTVEEIQQDLLYEQNMQQQQPELEQKQQYQTTDPQQANFRFVCQFCGYSTNHGTNLKRHIRTHTGESPFKCSICDFSCKQKHSLARHIRNIHSKNSEDLDT